MEITLGQLVQGSGAIATLNTQALPGRQALLLTRVTKALAPELQTYNEARLKVLKKHGTESADKSQFDWNSPEAQAAGEAC